MGMTINTNISALNAFRNLTDTQNSMSKSLEKLSSGFRINRAADDAAGLAISEGLKSQIGGLTVASRNAQDGISVIQTAEGSLSEVHTILQRLRDLAVQAGNDSNNDKSRDAISGEASKLVEELGRIADSTNFNGINLLDGSHASLQFQVGADQTKASQITVGLSNADIKQVSLNLNSGVINIAGTTVIGDTTGVAADLGGALTLKTDNGAGVTTDYVIGGLTATGTYGSYEEFADGLRSDATFSGNFTATVTKDTYGVGNGVIVTANDGSTVSVDATNDGGLVVSGAPTTSTGIQFDTAGNAAASIKLIDDQIAAVSSARAELGAQQNRFESATRSLAVSKENLTAANSRIRDVDMASEMVNFTRSQILSQAGTAMLAQANQSNQGVLQLLR